jgi:hypothetical protein
MIADPTAQQRVAWQDFVSFSNKEIVPRAEERDARQAVSPQAVRAMAEAGYLGVEAMPLRVG